jgi:hypothetical protein
LPQPENPQVINTPVVHTVAGRVSVTRDFPSDYTAQVDQHLAEIFKTNSAVTGIEFLGLENPHTATPDDPYWSPQGKAHASIGSAVARGEMTSKAAIAAYLELAQAPQIKQAGLSAGEDAEIGLQASAPPMAVVAIIHTA